MSDLGASIQQKRFTSVHLREGYDINEVDDFLDQLVVAADAGQPLAALCAAAQFAPVRLRQGYDMGEVDAFLDEVSATTAAASGAAPAPAAPPAVLRAQTPQPSVIEERKSLYERLFRGR